MNPARIYSNIIVLLLFFILSACSANIEAKKDPLVQLTSSMETSLKENILSTWYPLVIDQEFRGYLSGFDSEWKMKGNQDKSLVYETRHLWATSFIYEHYEKLSEYPSYQQHGFDFIRDKMWDKEYGGFYYIVNRQGEPLENQIGEKRIYGQAFAIYALSTYYSVSQNEEALELAKSAFSWIEEHAHDNDNGGYYEFLHRDGTPIFYKGPGDTLFYDHMVAGLKDYNSSIHILEALSSLYLVWNDPIVKQRLEEMFLIIRDTMIDKKGYLHLYFYPDWTIVPEDTLLQRAGKNTWFRDHITFGHDIETAFLLLEAAEVLENHDEVTAEIAKKLVDHTLLNGWDKENGGIFEKGKYNEELEMEIIDRHKAWWSQIEAMNSLVIMYSRYPNDPINYGKYMFNQWEHINTYLIDHKNKGWYNASIDTNPDARSGDKAHNWKTSYHTARGMINSINNLKLLINDSSE